MRVALTIAGSDSGGGAGLQADLKTFAALRVHGTCVVTAVTAQNTTKVADWAVVQPRQLVGAQLTAVLDDFPVAAAKTGMLGAPEVVEAIASGLAGAKFPLVVDPLLAASTGAALGSAETAAAMRARLFPIAALLTPNRPEAAALTGRPVESKEEVREAARALLDLGPKVVLLKGGHGSGETCDDLFYDGRELTWLSGPRIATRSTHGTGCTLSAAIVAWLARGAAPLDACRRAKRFVEGAMAAARPLGRGPGPLHPMHPYYPWEGHGEEEGNES